MIIDDIQILSGGRTNLVFAFGADGERYVCRYPGRETQRFSSLALEMYEG